MTNWTTCVLLIAVSAVWTVQADDSKRLRLKVLKHQPCTPQRDGEKIRFPSIDEAPLKPDTARGDGCYAIGGLVQVTKEIKGTVQLYLETRYGTKTPVEVCHNADKNGCGGVGSCVYCDACAGLQELGKSAVQLDVGGQTLNCATGLAPKNYTDIKMSFCMPTKQEFLDAQSIDGEFWNRFGAQGQLFFLTMYIFDKPVNKMSSSALQKIAIPTGENVIGCHKLVGSVYENK